MQLQRAFKVIKSVQRGVGSLSGATSVDVVIASVDMSKSVLNLCGVHTSSTASGSWQGESVKMSLKSSSIVEVVRAGTAGVSSHFSWEVIEYV